MKHSHYEENTWTLYSTICSQAHFYHVTFLAILIGVFWFFKLSFSFFRRLIRIVKQKDDEGPTMGYVYSVIMLVLLLAQSLFRQQFSKISYITALRVKSLIIALVYRKVWFIEWMIRWMSEWMNEWMNESTNKRMNERMNEWTYEKNERMKEWTHERMKEWMNEWMN